jgi:hypothetical protein
MILAEGGNVFKNTDGSEATQRIARDNVVPTVQWLEQLTGLNLVDNMLGTTGKKESSGDLDLAVDANAISKDVLIQQLLNKGVPKTDIKKSGDSVHVKTPILGDPSNGYVQTDFMFGNPEWQRWSLRGASEGSPYKGVHRQILMASIAKAQGMKWSYKNGLVDRETNQVISQNPTEIAQKLIGGTPADLESVETIIAKIKPRADYEQLVADAKEALARDNLSLPESQQVLEGSAVWFRNFML